MIIDILNLQKFTGNAKEIQNSNSLFDTGCHCYCVGASFDGIGSFGLRKVGT